MTEREAETFYLNDEAKRLVEQARRENWSLEKLADAIWNYAYALGLDSVDYSHA